MPRGIPNAPKIAEPPENKEAQSNETPEVKKPAELPKIIQKMIPVHTMPGKAIDVSDHGYDFQNIHFRRDIPVDVLAHAFVARVGEGEKADTIKEAFFQPQSMINLYANSQKKRRVRVTNGIVEYGTERYAVPLINPEVILRVLEDRWRHDRQARSFFAGVKEQEYAKSIGNINKVYALLA